MARNIPKTRWLHGLAHGKHVLASCVCIRHKIARQAPDRVLLRLGQPLKHRTDLVSPQVDHLIHGLGLAPLLATRNILQLEVAGSYESSCLTLVSVRSASVQGSRKRAGLIRSKRTKNVTNEKLYHWLVSNQRPSLDCRDASHYS